MTERHDDGHQANNEEADAQTGPAAEEQPATAPAGAGQARNPGGGGWLALAALIVALVALLVVLVGGWWGWQRYQAFAAGQGELVRGAELTERADALGERIAELRGRLSSLDERTAGRDQSVAELREGIDSLKQTQSDITARMDRIAQTVQTSRGEWRRSEAAYLAGVAVHRVRYYQDVDAALGALKEADGLLAALGGEAIAARKAIREAIDRLLASEAPKLGKIAGALTAMAENIDTYALRAGAQPLPASADGGGDSGSGQAGSAVGRAWHELRGALGELAVVSGPEREVMPLRPADERFFLRQNLRLQLYTARLAALEGQPEVYRDALSRARDWLQRFFDTDAAAVADARERLATLADREVVTELPDIAGVLEPARQF